MNVLSCSLFNGVRSWWNHSETYASGVVLTRKEVISVNVLVILVLALLIWMFAAVFGAIADDVVDDVQAQHESMPTAVSTLKAQSPCVRAKLYEVAKNSVVLNRDLTSALETCPKPTVQELQREALQKP